MYQKMLKYIYLAIYPSKVTLSLKIFDLHFQYRYGIFKHIKGEAIEAVLPRIDDFHLFFNRQAVSYSTVAGGYFLFPL